MVQEEDGSIIRSFPTNTFSFYLRGALGLREPLTSTPYSTMHPTPLTICLLFLALVVSGQPKQLPPYHRGRHRPNPIHGQRQQTTTEAGAGASSGAAYKSSPGVGEARAPPSLGSGRHPYGRHPRWGQAQPPPPQSSPSVALPPPPPPQPQHQPPPPPQPQPQNPPGDTRDNKTNSARMFGWDPERARGSCGSKCSNLEYFLLKQEFLFAHNWVRILFKQPLLTWDEKLASAAGEYAMKRAEDCKMVHSELPYGENIFWGLKLHWKPSDAVFFWYQEKQWFDFRNFKCMAPHNKSCGHFTQIVWKDSLRLGCAVQHCLDPSLGMLIICEYDPPGNYDDENPFGQQRTR